MHANLFLYFFLSCYVSVSYVSVVLGTCQTPSELILCFSSVWICLGLSYLLYDYDVFFSPPIYLSIWNYSLTCKYTCSDPSSNPHTHPRATYQGRRQVCRSGGGGLGCC